MLYNDKPDILCITETWLQPALPNSLIVFDSNYSVFRTDRSSDRTGGGVCILTSNATIKATSVAIPSKSEMERVQPLPSTSRVRVQEISSRVQVQVPPCGTRVRVRVWHYGTRVPSSSTSPLTSHPEIYL